MSDWTMIFIDKKLFTEMKQYIHFLQSTVANSNYTTYKAKASIHF